MLSNDNIRLRALEPEDLDIIYEWENDMSEWDRGDTLAPYSRYSLKQHIAKAGQFIYKQNQLSLMIEQLGTMRRLGMIDLSNIEAHHRKAAIGILIHKTYRRQGIAAQAIELMTQYAFNVLLLHQVYGHIAVDNQASLRLFKRCGYEIAGTLRDWIARPGGYVSVQIVQRLNH
ncbi:MAG: GNAT family N-acetyltransferase [Tannerellaceae bacterium]|jgi:diamine N-acetyltransferase|nr:GNAT family N-acetyltransferase [Tannerellaceae bacterium]